MSLCFLVSVVIHVGDSGLEDVQVDLVLHRPQTRLETGDRHCLRGLQSGVNNRGFWQLRVVLVVDQDFLRLVKRDQYPQLPAAPQEIEKATLETVEESSFRGKVTPFSEVIPVAFLAGERMTTSASVHDSVVAMCVQWSFGRVSRTASFDPSPSESSELDLLVIDLRLVHEDRELPSTDDPEIICPFVCFQLCVLDKLADHFDTRQTTTPTHTKTHQSRKQTKGQMIYNSR